MLCHLSSITVTNLACLSYDFLLLYLLYIYLQAYEKGLMIAVVPFTSKVGYSTDGCLFTEHGFLVFIAYYLLQILDACQVSVAYRPPNPWTMGVLGLLVEIYSMPNLKMNLKFEIEVYVYM